MKTIIQLLKTVILFYCIYFIACFGGNDSGDRQIPQTTSAYEFRTLLTANMIDESSGLVINEDNSIVHVGTGQAILRTKLIKPSFSTFHTGFMGYLYMEKAIFSEYRERVQVHFRLTKDGGETWTGWNDDLNLLSTENTMWDNEPDDRFGYLLSGSFPDKLYNGVQVKIVSEEINQGQKIIDILRFSFNRQSTEWFEDRKRHSEEAERKKK